MIHVVRSVATNSSFQWFYYQIAGQIIAFCEPVNTLRAFQFDGDSSASFSLGSLDALFAFNAEVLSDDNSRCEYQDKIHFNNQLCSIKLWRLGSFAQIDIDGEPSCQINFDKKFIVVLNDHPLNDLFNIELITGPAIILLLAQYSIFSLHAGGVTIRQFGLDPVNVAFIAESGVGKSTLSKGVGEQWRQFSDDILPISMNQVAKVYSDYPQLKIENYCLNNCVDNKLHYIFNLSSDLVEEIKIEKMSAVDAVLAVVRHTVAARLFEPQVMKKHLDFAQSLIASVSVYRISYPRNINELSNLRKTISAFVMENKN